MLLWVFLLIFLFLASGGCLFFLIRSVRRFWFVAKLSRGRRGAGWCISCAAVLLPTAAAWYLWGFMNTVIILLHLSLFWMLAALLQRLAERRRGGPLRRYYAGGLAVLFTAVYLGVGAYQAYHVWQTDYTIPTEKSVGSLRVVLLADSHVGTTFDGEGLNAHMQRIQAQEPDIVVVAGDFVDEDTTKENMLAACRALGTLDTPYGVYFVFGNHDKGLYSGGSRGYTGDDLIAALEENGVTVLQDQVADIDGRFCLIGRQDASEALDFGGSRADIRTLAQEAGEERFSIVLDHQPRDYAAQAEAGVDLVLSGHTHGGQLIPLMQFMRWFHTGSNDSIYGLERREHTDFIVTSGISDWAIKFKTGCISEFVIIDIVGK